MNKKAPRYLVEYNIFGRNDYPRRSQTTFNCLESLTVDLHIYKARNQKVINSWPKEEPLRVFDLQEGIEIDIEDLENEMNAIKEKDLASRVQQRIKNLKHKIKEIKKEIESLENKEITAEAWREWLIDLYGLYDFPKEE